MTAPRPPRSRETATCSLCPWCAGCQSGHLHCRRCGCETTTHGPAWTPEVGRAPYFDPRTADSLDVQGLVLDDLDRGMRRQMAAEWSASQRRPRPWRLAAVILAALVVVLAWRAR